jgi:hypothetical protein
MHSCTSIPNGLFRSTIDIQILMDILFLMLTYRSARVGVLRCTRQPLKVSWLLLFGKL